jgi:hypothetical protein
MFCKKLLKKNSKKGKKKEKAVLPVSPERELAMRAAAAPLVPRRGHVAAALWILTGEVAAAVVAPPGSPRGGGLPVRAVDELAAGASCSCPHASWPLPASPRWI